MMTGRERIERILKHKPVDRIGVYEHFWTDTRKHWVEQGHLHEDESLEDHFDFDMSECWAARYVVDPEFQDEVVEETEDTRIIRDGNGALLRRHKQHDSTPEHIGYAVNDRAAWEELARPRLTPDRSRLAVDAYRKARRQAAVRNRFFLHSGVNVFEAIHPLVGHENLLLGMGLDPDWIRDMVEVYADLIIQCMEMLFTEAGKPDGIWFYEDMGFKGRPFMSPEMYAELILPGHRRTIEFAHSLGLPVVMHSCGFIEPLIPGIIEAGVDCLQVIEVKAGMDLLKIKREYGDRLALCGGLDARNLVANDLDAIDRELAEKIPAVMRNSGYILHSDHSIPVQCEYATFRHFLNRGMELGTYR